jgi:hypothetical protein
MITSPRHLIYLVFPGVRVYKPDFYYELLHLPELDTDFSFYSGLLIMHNLDTLIFTTDFCL